MGGGLTWSHLDSLVLTWTYLDSFGLIRIHLDSLEFAGTRSPQPPMEMNMDPFLKMLICPGPISAKFHYLARDTGCSEKVLMRTPVVQ